MKRIIISFFVLSVAIIFFGIALYFNSRILGILSFVLMTISFGITASGDKDLVEAQLGVHK